MCVACSPASVLLQQSTQLPHCMCMLCPQRQLASTLCRYAAQSAPLSDCIFIAALNATPKLLHVIECIWLGHFRKRSCRKCLINCLIMEMWEVFACLCHQPSTLCATLESTSCCTIRHCWAVDGHFSLNAHVADNYFYPAWAYVFPTTVLRLPYSLLIATLWSCVVYYEVDLAPEASRSDGSTFCKRLCCCHACMSPCVFCQLCDVGSVGCLFV